MDIQNRKELKETAGKRLESCSNGGKITLIFASCIVGGSLIVNLIQIFLGSQISQTGGLQNMGLRSILSTFKAMMPILLNFLLMCISLGFTGAMLRIARGQYTTPVSMKIGFDRFWVLLRATILKSCFYMLAVMASYFISMQIFFLTPMSRKVISSLAPLVSGSSGDIMVLLENPAFIEQIIRTMLPLYLIMGLVFLAIAFPIYYRLILVNYILIDQPGTGALFAIHNSRVLMKGNCKHFFLLDLSLWPYYVLTALAMLILYTPNILMLCGVNLPMEPMIASLLFFAGHLLVTFLVTLLLQPKVEVTHALVYESLRPKEQPSGGVVLGNIFDMARDQNPM